MNNFRYQHSLGTYTIELVEKKKDKIRRLFLPHKLRTETSVIWKVKFKKKEKTR